MKWIVGIDEVGRGPIAGPVTVCAVAMPYELYKKARWRGLTDSKKLSVAQREYWYAKAKELETEGVLKIVVASKSAAVIDRQGIAGSIASCISSCMKKLKLDPSDTQVLLDGGLRAPKAYAHQQTIIRGDQSHKIISLASVVAKVTRDAYMCKRAKAYPGYGWETNMGYGTASHYKALKNLSTTSLHRKSFLTKVLDI